MRVWNLIQRNDPLVLEMCSALWNPFLQRIITDCEYEIWIVITLIETLKIMLSGMKSKNSSDNCPICGVSHTDEMIAERVVEQASVTPCQKGVFFGILRIQLPHKNGWHALVKPLTFLYTIISLDIKNFRENGIIIKFPNRYNSTKCYFVYLIFICYVLYSFH